MADPVMMLDVAKTYDEFGTCLAKLRKERGLSSAALSEAIGKSEAYIAGWEGETKRGINKQVLHQVSAVLNLSDAERYELFRLADKRAGIDEMRQGRGPWEQVWLNVSQVCAEVPHEIGPHVSDKVLAGVVELQGWLLAGYAAGSQAKGLEIGRIAWPQKLYDESLVDAQGTPAAERTQIPDIISYEFRELDSCFPLTDVSARLIAAQMANTYTRWLLSDLDRCRQLAKSLEFWSVVEDEEVGAVVIFRFKETMDEEAFGLPGRLIELGTVKSWREGTIVPGRPSQEVSATDRPGISLLTATTKVRRTLATVVFTLENSRHSRNHEDRYYAVPFKIEVADSNVLLSLILARQYLRTGRTGKPRLLRQAIRDAWCLVNPDDLDHEFLEYVHAAAETFAPDGSNPCSWSKADQLEQTRIIMLDTLIEAALKLNRELRVGKAHPPKSMEPKGKRNKKGRHR